MMLALSDGQRFFDLNKHERFLPIMACCVLNGIESVSNRKALETVEVEITAIRKPCKTCKEVKIKKEILDEIEDFTVNDEVNYEKSDYGKTDPRREGRQEENSKVSHSYDQRRGICSVSKTETTSDEYVDFEECITALTTGNRLMCTVCRIEFPGEAEFKIHMIGHSHGKLFQCAFCGKQFLESFSLKKHLAMHEESKVFSCRHCRLHFEKESLLKSHEAEVHAKRRMYECMVCKKKLLHRQSLRDHNLMHKNVKPFECASCKKKFLRSSSLRAHMIVHTAESPFACDLCPAKFKRSSVLKTHKLTHTTDRRFECDICKQRFHLKGALKHHILAHYGVRPYKCEDCGKCYRRSWGLKVHRYRHTGVQRFECDLCKSRFSIKTKLAKHIYGHMGEKPYKCQVCGRQYGERYQLKTHKCNTVSNTAPLKTKVENIVKDPLTQIVFFHLKRVNESNYSHRRNLICTTE